MISGYPMLEVHYHIWQIGHLLSHTHTKHITHGHSVFQSISSSQRRIVRSLQRVLGSVLSTPWRGYGLSILSCLARNSTSSTWNHTGTVSAPCPTLTPQLVSSSYQRRILSMRLCPTLLPCCFLFQCKKKPEYEVVSNLCSQGHFFFPHENLGMRLPTTFKPCSLAIFSFNANLWG